MRDIRLQNIFWLILYVYYECYSNKESSNNVFDKDLNE